MTTATKRETRGRKFGVKVMGGKFYKGLDDAKRAILKRALRAHKGNVTAAAAELEITRAYFYKLAEDLDVTLR